MPRTRTVLVVGAFRADQRKRIDLVTRQEGFEPVIHEGIDAAFEWLQGKSPRVVLFEAALPKVHALCLRIRARRELVPVPVIGLVKAVSDSAIAKLFAAGADDFVPTGSSQALQRRLRTIPVEESIYPPPSRGAAVAADADHDRCEIIGRMLASAGYEVRYAVERRMLDHYATGPDVELIVASAELGDPVQMVKQARAGGCKGSWIVTDIERDAACGAELIQGVRDAVIVSAFLPPDCLLFTSNEMKAHEAVSKRAHKRVMHSTIVLFRQAGWTEDDLGVTYNVSEGGVFVRTLAPPAVKTPMAVELRPPGDSKTVRLEGVVAWAQPSRPGTFANTPAGFGVQWVGGAEADRQAWSTAIARLVPCVQRRRSVNELLEETLRDSIVEAIPAPVVAQSELPDLSDFALSPSTPEARPPARGPVAPQPARPGPASPKETPQSAPRKPIASSPKDSPQGPTKKSSPPRPRSTPPPLPVAPVVALAPKAPAPIVDAVPSPPPPIVASPVLPIGLVAGSKREASAAAPVPEPPAPPAPAAPIGNIVDPRTKPAPDAPPSAPQPAPLPPIAPVPAVVETPPEPALALDDARKIASPAVAVAAPVRGPRWRLLALLAGGAALIMGASVAAFLALSSSDGSSPE
ncbi:MAG TPA: PilZ domain-containing protein, partial [Polyangiaceae bacterium]|nr:PilZ domain-containing protein [Polyangiaceae bacterium]